MSQVADLGQGFGGLTYDAARDVFWTIKNVNNTGSRLFTLKSSGSPTSSLTLGDGCAGLAVVSGVPEPSTLLFAATGFLIAALRRNRPHPKN